MGANIWFWLIYVIVGIFGGLLFGMWRNHPYAPFGWGLVLFILIGLLGWHDFGPPIR